MNLLILLTLVQALSLSVAPDAPAAADPVPDEVKAALPGANVGAQANVSTTGLSVDVRVDDRGLFLRTALPGPGFGHSLDPAPEASVETGLGEHEKSGWGPAVPVQMPEPREAAVPVGLAVLGAVAYAGFRWRYLGPGLLMPLYSRLSRSDLLENEVRARLLEVITERPGLSLQELAEESGAGWGTTVYHLQRLEQAEFIKSRKQGHHRRYYKVGECDPQDQKALGMLRNDTPRKIAQYLIQDPGCMQKDVCEALDISPSLAHKYLKRLEEQELVSSRREWRSKHYTPDERLAMLVEQAAA